MAKKKATKAKSAKRSSKTKKKASTTKKAPRRTKRGQGKSPEDTCFVMCPFSGFFGRYSKEIYEPAIEAAGLKPTRADDLYLPSAIMGDIWAMVQACKVGLADVTDRNPNVLYELGLAHATQTPVVIITQREEDVPFDLKHLRWISYDTRAPGWDEELRANIKKAVIQSLKSPNDAVPPTFLSVGSGDESPDDESKFKVLELKINSIQREIAEMKADSIQRVPRGLVSRVAGSLARVISPPPVDLISVVHDGTIDRSGAIDRSGVTLHGAGMFSSSDEDDGSDASTAS